MKSFSRVGVILVVIGLLILGNLKAWGADWRLYSSSLYGDDCYDSESIIHPSKGLS